MLWWDFFDKCIIAHFVIQMNKERNKILNFGFFWKYILKREEILEQSGSEHFVSPLIFGLKENINFSLREICVALVPLFYVLMLCFCFFSFLHIFTKQHTHTSKHNNIHITIMTTQFKPQELSRPPFSWFTLVSYKNDHTQVGQDEV